MSRIKNLRFMLDYYLDSMTTTYNSDEFSKLSINAKYYLAEIESLLHECLILKQFKGEKMINEDKAFRMFCEKYVEKHKGQSMEVGGYGSCSFK